MLIRTSQSSNRKVADIAEELAFSGHISRLR